MSGASTARRCSRASNPVSFAPFCFLPDACFIPPVRWPPFSAVCLIGRPLSALLFLFCLSPVCVLGPNVDQPALLISLFCNYYMPSNLADAMIRLFDGSSNEGLSTLSQILRRGQHTLGQVWTNQFSPQSTEDLEAANAVLPGLRAQFEAAQHMSKDNSPQSWTPNYWQAQTVNFPRFLVRLAWILQHAATLLRTVGDIQAVLNFHTTGVSDIHAWGLMLPSSSRVSPVTYHSVVAVRYPDLCRLINDMWELGSFASGGLPDRPPAGLPMGSS